MTYPIKDRPNESSFEDISLLITEETSLISLEKTRLLYLSLVCSSLVFYSSNKDCQVSTAWPVEVISIVLPNSFPLCLFSFTTFNNRVSGSALQPLRCRPSEDQGSSANRRQEEANHQPDTSRGTCNAGAKRSLKISRKSGDHLDICIFMQCTVEKSVSNLQTLSCMSKLRYNLKRKKINQRKKAVQFVISQSGQLFITQCFHGCESHC